MLREEALKERLALSREYVDLLGQSLKVRLALLFGSWARGEATLESDMDVMVVADNLSTDLRENFSRLKMRGRFSRINCLAYHSEDFNKRLENLSFVILDALTEGIVIRKDEDFYEEIETTLKQLRDKYRIKKHGRYWIFTHPSSEESRNPQR